MKKIWLGLTVSGVFIYFSLRGVDFDILLKGLREANYGFMVPAIFLLLLLMLLRSLRWGVILSPLGKVDQKTLFPITCIGYMAIALIPMRLGEIVRPFLISNKKKEIPLTSSLATVLVERVLDALTLAAVLLGVLLVLPLPDWLITLGAVVLGVSLILVAAIVLSAFKTDAAIRVVSPIFKILPIRLNTKVISLLRSFSDGFKVATDPKRFGYILLLTLLIWTTAGAAVYFLFPVSNLQLPLAGALTVLVLTDLAIVLPAAPGFVGNFHFAGILALAFFDVGRTEALAFTTIYHVLGVGINIILGLVFLPFENTSLKEIKSFRNL